MVAVALLALGVGGDRPATTTVLEQAPSSSAPGAGAGEAGGSVLSARDIYERDADGVVFVSASTSAIAAGAPFGPGRSQQGRTSSGSGFVLDARGHILTNRHVVGDARTVRVEFTGDRAVDAQVIGEDPTNDLALLRVDPGAAELRPLALGDSSSARVGDPVLAIGNPFGLDRTLTTGVVSALSRQLRAPNGFTMANVIQTDAPITPGSSGGPLLDASGRVIGITSQIAADAAGGNAGIGVAVPINTAKRLLPELKRTGRVAHAYVGIQGITIDDSLRELQLRSDHGVLVQTVYARSPAAKAGVRGGTIESQLAGRRIQLGGDVIVSLDGRPLGSMEELTAAMAQRRPGDVVKLGILRDGRALQLAVKLGTAPKRVPSASQTP